MLRGIAALAVGYVIAIAGVMFYTSSDGEKLSGISFGEVAFAAPTMIAALFALTLRGTESRRALLMFQVGYSILTLLIFASTFSGEHDAQYQLALLIIPLIGFPAVAVAGVIAVLLRSKRQSA